MRTSMDLSNRNPITGLVSQTLANDNGVRNVNTDNAINKDLNIRNENVIKTTNNCNKSLNSNPFNSNIPFKPSIGKWMYESDAYLEVAIDLSNKTNSFAKQMSDSDDIIFIESCNAGPSGLSVVHNKSINCTLTSDCDLNPSIDSSTQTLNIDEILFDTEIQSIGEIITIPVHDLSSDDSDDCDSSSGALNANEEEENGDDVEIIKVKFFNQPIEIDSDIEVLSEILTPKEVIDLMRSDLKSVQQLTQLSYTTIRVIMTKYKWNKDLFVSEFFEFGIQRILEALKLVISYELKVNAKRRKTKEIHKTIGNELSESSQTTSAADEQRTCLVCYDETNASEMFGANCGHYLCIECWNQYITTKINDKSDEKMSCPGDDCPNILDDEDMCRIIQEKAIRDRFRRLITNSFVSKNALLRWCPNGDCLHAVRVKQNGFQDIECICKTVFCFLCGDQWHEPLSCELYKNWIQKFASHSIDPNSAKWLVANTKCCPKCHFPIEKNGGCNYVLCTKCRYSFCYHCLGKCSHGRCLGQNASDAQKAQQDDERLKQDLRLYPFYKDSYQNQLKQLTLEKKLQAGVNQKLEKAVKSLEFKSALKFLKSAFTVLCHCRQTLMYSYVFGYYLMGPQNEIDVYVNNLSQLERKTMELSKILTNETTVIQKDSVIEMKRKVQNTYRECESNRSALVQHIKTGLTQNYWQFIPI